MKEKVSKDIVSVDTWALANAFARRFDLGKEIELGATYAAILDILDATAALYNEDLPRIAKLKGASPDDLLEELVDLRMELEHLRDHADDALAEIEGISQELRRRSYTAEATAAKRGTNAGASGVKIARAPKTLYDLVSLILSEEGQPLHYTEITNRVIAKRLWPSGKPGKTPQNSLFRTVTEDIKKHHRNSIFTNQRGLVGLRQ